MNYNKPSYLIALEILITINVELYLKGSTFSKKFNL